MVYKDYLKLYNKYRPKLIKLFNNKVKDLDLSEDLAQDTLTRVYDKMDTYNDKYAMSTWIYSIAFNILADHFRSASRSPSLSFCKEVYDNEHTESTDSPENIAIAKEQEAKYDTILNNLNKDYLEAYTLKDITGMSYEDISSQLNVPINTVKSRVKRARDQIAKELA